MRRTNWTVNSSNASTDTLSNGATTLRAKSTRSSMLNNSALFGLTPIATIK